LERQKIDLSAARVSIEKAGTKFQLKRNLQLHYIGGRLIGLIFMGFDAFLAQRF
jgi:hypothetical protein